MKLENEFTVPAPVERAWEILLDLDRVAPCLPGAAIEGSEGDEHTGTMTVKIGPITARYKGTVKIEEADEQARRAVMRAQARDSRGQGTAAATITSTMEEVEGGTRVHVETDMRVTGPAAQFGRGVMQDVSAKLMGRFADCLAEEIDRQPGGRARRACRGRRGGARHGRPAEPGRDAASRPGRRLRGGGRRAAAAPPPRRTEEVLDLGEASRDAVLKRLGPVAARPRGPRPGRDGSCGRAVDRRRTEE